MAKKIEFYLTAFNGKNEEIFYVSRTAFSFEYPDAMKGSRLDMMKRARMSGLGVVWRLTAVEGDQ